MKGTYFGTILKFSLVLPRFYIFSFVVEYYQVEVKLFGTEKIVPLDKTRGSVKNSNIEAGAALTHFLCAVEIIIMMSCPN